MSSHVHGLGWKVESLRKDRKLSRRELAVLSSVSEQTIYRVETGRVTATTATLVGISRGLKVDFKDLVRGTM